MEILVHLNEENSKRLLALREIGIIDIDIDNICNKNRYWALYYLLELVAIMKLNFFKMLKRR